MQNPGYSEQGMDRDRGTDGDRQREKDRGRYWDRDRERDYWAVDRKRGRSSNDTVHRCGKSTKHMGWDRERDRDMDRGRAWVRGCRDQGMDRDRDREGGRERDRAVDRKRGRSQDYTDADRVPYRTRHMGWDRERDRNGCSKEGSDREKWSSGGDENWGNITNKDKGGDKERRIGSHSISGVRHCNSSSSDAKLITHKIASVPDCTALCALLDRHSEMLDCIHVSAAMKTLIKMQDVSSLEERRKQECQSILIKVLNINVKNLNHSRTIANILWGLAKMHWKMDAALKRDMLGAVQRQLHAFNQQDIANTLWALAKMGVDMDAALKRDMMGAVQRQLHAFSPQGIANTLWALATMGVDMDASLKRDMLQAVQRQLHAFNQQDIANTVWALATMGVDMDATLKRDMLQAVQRQLHAFNQQNVANTVWALAKMGVDMDATLKRDMLQAVQRQLHAFNQQEIANTVWALAKMVVDMDAALKRDMMEAVQRQLHAFNPQEIANTVWALAKMGVDMDATLKRDMMGAVQRQLHVFNPQDIANTVWALATMGVDMDASLKRDMLQAVQRQLHAFNQQDIANTVWALATMGVDMDATLKRDMLQAVQRQLHAFNPQGIANTVWALAKMGVDMDASLKRDMMEAVQRQLHAFNPQEIANTVWALAKMGVDMDATLKRDMMGAVQRQLHAFNPQDIANTLWALATMGVDMDAALKRDMMEAVQRQLHAFNPQEIANTVWALAKMGVDMDATLKRDMMGAVQRQLHAFSPQDIANTVWALATMGVEMDASLKRDMLQAVQRQLRAFNQQDIANTVWALATMGVDMDAALKRDMLQAVQRQLHAFNPQGIANTVWALATMGVDMDASLKRDMLQAVQRQLHAFNQQDIANTLWALATMGVDMDAALKRDMMGAVQRQLHAFSPQGIANTLWALAKIERQQRYTTETPQSSIPCLDSMLVRWAQFEVAQGFCARPSEYTAIISACKWTGQLSKATQLFEAYRASGYELNNVLCAAGVDVYRQLESYGCIEELLRMAETVPNLQVSEIMSSYATNLLNERSKSTVPGSHVNLLVAFGCPQTKHYLQHPLEYLFSEVDFIMKSVEQRCHKATCSLVFFHGIKLQEALGSKHHFHIVHISCHSDADALVLEKAGSKGSYTITPKKLHTWLVKCPQPPQLLILNGCATLGFWKGIPDAESLEMVICWDGPVLDHPLFLFTKGLYRQFKLQNFKCTTDVVCQAFQEACNCLMAEYTMAPIFDTIDHLNDEERNDMPRGGLPRLYIKGKEYAFVAPQDASLQETMPCSPAIPHLHPTPDPAFDPDADPTVPHRLPAHPHSLESPPIPAAPSEGLNEYPQLPQSQAILPSAVVSSASTLNIVATNVLCAVTQSHGPPEAATLPLPVDSSGLPLDEYLAPSENIVETSHFNLAPVLMDESTCTHQLQCNGRTLKSKKSIRSVCVTCCSDPLPALGKPNAPSDVCLSLTVVQAPFDARLAVGLAALEPGKQLRRSTQWPGHTKESLGCHSDGKLVSEYLSKQAGVPVSKFEGNAFGVAWGKTDDVILLRLRHTATGYWVSVSVNGQDSGEEECSKHLSTAAMAHQLRFIVAMGAATEVRCTIEPSEATEKAAST